MDLIDNPLPGNNPEFTVSELSGAVKRVIEGEFGLVRVRGEVGRVSRPASGHLYFALKDDRASLDAVSWKGQVAKMQVRPEEGMEVVATGRMTTFPGQSKYQLIVEDVAPAGVGALMALLEKRRAALAAEGLFDAGRKKPIPYLPLVIGVVTSPSGAVIRDILHRLRDRFPRHVLIWPVAVQGQACASEVATAIRGFNAMAPGGPIPRPDLIIVARGGGSLEDLWGFNEEVVVRAAADSRIPLISAVGHETDTTLIDFAADLRAPTPTAAAELAVPVRLDLLAGLDARGARLSGGVARAVTLRRQQVADLARALPRLDSLLASPRQRLDLWAGRLAGALGLASARKRAGFAALQGRLRVDVLTGLITRRRERVTGVAAAMNARAERQLDRARGSFDKWASRLDPALARALADAGRNILRNRDLLAALDTRLQAAPARQLTTLHDRLDRLDRLRQTLGPDETLKRGFVILRGDGAVVTSRGAAERASVIEAQFHDGRLILGAKAPKKPRAGGGSEQGSLL